MTAQVLNREMGITHADFFRLAAPGSGRPVLTVYNPLVSGRSVNSRFKKMKKSADLPREIGYINSLGCDHAVAACRREFRFRQTTGWQTLFSRLHGLAVALLFNATGR